MLAIRRQSDNRNPHGIEPQNVCDTLINAVCCSLGLSWAESFGLLYSQAHRLCLMPNDGRCLKGMLSGLCFFQQPDPKEKLTAEEYLTRYQDGFSGEELIILRLRSPTKPRDIFTAVCTKTFCGIPYRAVISGSGYINGYVSEVWIRWADCKDHSVKKRSKGGRKPSKCYTNPPESNALHVVNENPAGNRIGDCVVRAMAVCLGLDWHTTLDLLAEATGHTYPMVNFHGVYDRLLIAESFERKEPLRQNGRLLTAAEFCRHVRDLYPVGSVFFVQLGKNHAAALRLFGDTYKVCDTWDSTGYKVGIYWVRYPGRPAKQE